MNETGIRWADMTWNPMSGCEKVSEGCKLCYAEVIAEQKGKKAFPDGFGLTLRPHKLNEPYDLEGEKRIFVNSMSDMFWEQIPDEYRDLMVDVMEKTPQHQYQVLTKRPEAMLRYSLRRPFPPNFWAGVSIENQRNAGRLDILKQVKAPILFVSAEPLLGPLTLDFYDEDGMPSIDWLIVGGESGEQITRNPIGQSRALVEKVGGKWVPKADGLEWVRSLRDQCLGAANNPIARHPAFFFKQWGGPTSNSGGHQLDGRTWDEFPNGRRVSPLTSPPGVE